MGNKRSLTGRCGLLAAVLFLQLFILALPVYADTTWQDVSSSINDAFSGNQAFSVGNILGFIFIALVISLVALAFRYSWLKEQRERQKKLHNRIVLKPLGPQSKRYFYRVRVSMELEWVTAAEAVERRNIRYKKDRLVDISGGGLCFTTIDKLNSGDKLKLLLDTEPGNPLSLDGLVVRVDEEAGQEGTTYKVSVQFEDLLEGERDRIVSLISKSQRDVIQSKKQVDITLP